MISGEGPTFSVEVSPGEVDAGAEMTLKAKASCSPAADLSGQALQIMDQDGALVERAELTEFDGESSETSEFAVKAPVEPGAYTWLAVCPALATAGSSSEETSAPFSFTVKPHSTRVVVWDVPSTIESGETFSVKLGVNCSSECRPDGWTVEVRDQDGERRATVTFGGEPWPGTSALYYAEVELSAPDTDGLHTLEARALADDLPLPHAEAVAPLA